MRLLVDARLGWGHGIGRVITNTVPRVAMLKPGWQLDVLVHPDNFEEASVALGGVGNLGLIPCPLRPFSLGEQIGLMRYGNGYDLTWFTNYWVPLGWKSPFVATVHDMLHLVPEFFPASRLKRLLSQQTFAKLRRDARAVVFVSRFSQDTFEQMIGKPKRGVTIPLGGDHLDYGEIVPIAKRSRRLLVVAASKKHKNFELLLESWNRANVADHWFLTIVTPDAMFRSSVDLSAIAEGARQTEILRGVSNVALAELYGDTTVLLMPSLYEGFGLPLLEGMLAGALCVSSSAPAMVEVAQSAFLSFVNGRDRLGWSESIEQVCAAIDRNDLDLDTIQKHNLQCAQRFRWEHTARETAALLEGAVG